MGRGPERLDPSQLILALDHYFLFIHQPLDWTQTSPCRQSVACCTHNWDMCNTSHIGSVHVEFDCDTELAPRPLPPDPSESTMVNCGRDRPRPAAWHQCRGQAAEPRRRLVASEALASAFDGLARTAPPARGAGHDPRHMLSSLRLAVLALVGRHRCLHFLFRPFRARV